MVRAEDEDVEHKKLISFIYFRFYSESISRFSTSRRLARRFAYLLSNNVRNATRFLSPSFFSFFFRFFKAEEFRVFI